MSLGLLGEYDSDHSEISDSDEDLLEKTEICVESVTFEPSDRQRNSRTANIITEGEDSTKAGYDPFGICATQDPNASDSSNSSDVESLENETNSSSEPPSLQLPLPELLGVDRPTLAGHKSDNTSSVFSNPYKRAEEEKMAILKHHVKELAPEESKERGKHFFRNKKKFPNKLHPSTNTSKPANSGAYHGEVFSGSRNVTLSEQLFDENDNHPGMSDGKRKHRSGVKDSLTPPKKFLKTHSRIQASTKSWPPRP